VGDIIGNLIDKFSGLFFSSDHDRLSAKDFLKSTLMRLPMKRIKFIQSPAYDYWTETLEELDFLYEKNGEETQSRMWSRRLRRSIKNPDPSEMAKGTYIIANNAREVRESLEKGELPLILTIEGMHALGTEGQLHHLFDRIEYLKVKYPICFITFAHHFDNFLCGHAHSLIKSATLFVNQKQGLQADFNDIGMDAARYLLSLRPDGTKNLEGLGRRILLDVKHMGAESRKTYYEKIVRRCMNDHQDIIPVIASHVAYSGVGTLDELIANWKKGKEEDGMVLHEGLNHWNINVCDEDITIILQTGGLLGLCLDQRILGQQEKKAVPGKTLIRHNLKMMLHNLHRNSQLTEAEKARIWEVLCIGSDFEGYIDPAADYATVMEFEKLEEDLVEIIEGFIAEGYQAEFHIHQSPKTLARNLMMENVMRFLDRNFW
jgi:microsomal dipeptidase-like Zn-dependent dipeptidase